MINYNEHVLLNLFLISFIWRQTLVILQSVYIHTLRDVTTGIHLFFICERTLLLQGEHFDFCLEIKMSREPVAWTTHTHALRGLP